MAAAPFRQCPDAAGTPSVHVSLVDTFLRWLLATERGRVAQQVPEPSPRRSTVARGHEPRVAVRIGGEGRLVVGPPDLGNALHPNDELGQGERDRTDLVGRNRVRPDVASFGPNPV